MSILISLLLAAAAPQADGASAATCTLPPEFAGWNRTGTSRIGNYFTSLTFDPSTTMVTNMPAEARSYGGRVAMPPFPAKAAGNYQIAVSEGTWIALATPNGRSVIASTGDGPVPPCGGIAKVSNFTVTAGGNYNLVIAGAAGQNVRILVTRLP